jgi:hypothetical protein
MPVLYEVLITVREDLRAAFEAYMIGTHIPDVISTGTFSAATLATIEPGLYRASYSASSLEELDNYLRDHSPRLREDVAEQFPEGLTISREVWDVLASF